MRGARKAASNHTCRIREAFVARGTLGGIAGNSWSSGIGRRRRGGRRRARHESKPERNRQGNNQGERWTKYGLFHGFAICL
jgi:hypothetical protein